MRTSLGVVDRSGMPMAMLLVRLEAGLISSKDEAQHAYNHDVHSDGWACNCVTCAAQKIHTTSTSVEKCLGAQCDTADWLSLQTPAHVLEGLVC